MEPFTHEGLNGCFLTITPDRTGAGEPALVINASPGPVLLDAKGEQKLGDWLATWEEKTHGNPCAVEQSPPATQ